MPRVPLAAAVLLALAVPRAESGLTQSGHGPVETVYGNDGRQDLYEVSDPALRQLARSTVALFGRSKVQFGRFDDGQSERDWRHGGLPVYARVSTQDYGPANNLCGTERFWNQPEGAFCSGALVGPDLVLTAGHCVTSQGDCENSVDIVFGFSLEHAGDHPDWVPKKEVYRCVELVDRQFPDDGDHGADWSLIRLDRRVLDHEPLRLSHTRQIQADTTLVMIGHPTGLPTKVDAGAVVLDPSPDGYFVANTDSYAGNSGSPVFNAETHLIEGVLVRGDRDFVPGPDGTCNVSKVCPQDASGCRGEDVTKASSIDDSLWQALHPGRSRRGGPQPE